MTCPFGFEDVANLLHLVFGRLAHDRGDTPVLDFPGGSASDQRADQEGKQQLFHGCGACHPWHVVTRARLG